MAGLAYSYLRFSTPEQARGDSRRRQLAMAEHYAQQHGLLLDKGLSFRDLGISAFRGRNAKQGGLRAFLDAIDHGLVPPDSYLLIESLDRLSRDQILEAQGLFLQIISAGVTIVTLLDQRAYSRASINRNPTDLIISLVYMMRANEESSTKSSRLKAAWAARRDRPGNGFHGSQCPGWLRPNAAKTGYDIIEAKVAVLRRIYSEALDGWGRQTIAQRLNEEQVPLFGRGNQRGKLWTRALIRHLLRTDLVIGTYTPCQSEIINGKVRYMPITSRPDYYPAVIDRVTWDSVQAQRMDWSDQHRCGDRKRRTSNVLARLARCPFCNRPMILSRTNIPNQRYLVCMQWREGRSCSDEWVRFPEIEDVFVSDARFLAQRCPEPVLNVAARRAMLKSITSRLSHLRVRLRQETVAREVMAIHGRAGPALRDETEAEMQKLLNERYRLRADRSYWKDATLKLKLEALLAATSAAPPDMDRINEVLRSLLLKVVVDWPRDTLVLHWRHGGQSEVGFWRRRQKGGPRNVTPANDRRLKRGGASSQVPA